MKVEHTIQMDAIRGVASTKYVLAMITDTAKKWAPPGLSFLRHRAEDADCDDDDRSEDGVKEVSDDLHLGQDVGRQEESELGSLSDQAHLESNAQNGMNSPKRIDASYPRR